MKSRLVIRAGVALAGVALLAACSGPTGTNNQSTQNNSAPASGDLKVAVITHGTAGDAFWSVVKVGAEDAGKQLGVVTSKLRDGAMRGLRISALDDAFDIVVGCDDVTHAKPHPEPVLKAVEELGAKAAETVFVGDSRHDMESGQAARVKTAAVLWGPFDRAHLEDLNPDYWLEKPEDLRQLYDQ